MENQFKFSTLTEYDEGLMKLKRERSSSVATRREIGEKIGKIKEEIRKIKKSTDSKDLLKSAKLQADLDKLRAKYAVLKNQSNELAFQHQELRLERRDFRKAYGNKR